MKVNLKQLSKMSFQLFILAVILFTVAACSSAQPGADNQASEADHSHAEGQEDDHGHEGESDDQSHSGSDADDHSHDGEEADDHSHDDQGSTTIGDSEVKIDHHGNPVFDEEERVFEQHIQEGVSIEFTVENFLGVGGRGGELAPRIVEGEHAVLQFHITDSASGAPLAGLKPAVWLDLVDGEPSDQACREQVQGYLGGTLEARPVIDLNSFFILGMNQENTISVIDPMVDVAGMTNLFAIILLQGTAQDWVMTPDHLKLFVSMPELNKVAVVDLDSFQVEANIELEGRPVRIAIQPDGKYVWVGVESQNGDQGGVAAIEVAGQNLVTQISTGAGAHSMAFSPDSRYVYVTNSDDGTLTVIDTPSLEVLEDLQVGIQPVAVAVAPESGAIYVSDQSSGAIVVIDAEGLQSSTQMMADPGVSAVGISPDGRWGFAVNPQAEKIYLFETLTNQISHAIPVKGTPDQITFTETAAYFRSNSSAAVFSIPFAEINPKGNVSVLTVPVGSLPPESAETTSVAQAVIPTPDGAALLVANPADDKIYFYTEGSQSALGGYQGHTLVPRAVQVVDRSLKERSPGVYTGGIRIPQSGDFTVAFLLDDPQIVHCFHFTAKPNPELAELASALKPDLKFSTTEQPKAGQVFSLQLELTDADTGEPIDGLQDMLVLARVLAGNWNQRATATDLGNGKYEVQFTFPNPGMYNLFFMVPSLNLSFEQLPQRNIQVIQE